MKEQPRQSGDSICSRKNATGPKNTKRFPQQAVLQNRRGDMMKHCEANHSIKLRVSKGHPSRIRRHDANVLT
jgi:hypothetical protein